MTLDGIKTIDLEAQRRRKKLSRIEQFPGEVPPPIEELEPIDVEAKKRREELPAFVPELGEAPEAFPPRWEPPEPTIEDLIGKIYADLQPLTLEFIEEWATEDPEAFLEDMVRFRGRTPDTELMLELFGATPELIEDIFAPVPPPKPLKIPEGGYKFTQEVEGIERLFTIDKDYLVKLEDTLIGKYDPERGGIVPWGTQQTVVPVDGVRTLITITPDNRAYDINNNFLGTYNTVTQEIDKVSTLDKASEVWDAFIFGSRQMWELGENFFLSALPNLVFQDTPAHQRAVYGDEFSNRMDAISQSIRNKFRSAYAGNKAEYEDWLEKNIELQPRLDYAEGVTEHLELLRDPWYWAYEFANIAPFCAAVIVSAMTAGALTGGNPLAMITGGAAIVYPVETQSVMEALLANGANEQQAAQIATPAGIIIASFESLGRLPLLKAVSPQLMRLFRKEVAEELGKLTARELFKRGIKTAGATELAEVITEVLQEATQNAAVKIVNENWSIFEGLEIIAAKTAVATAPLALFGGGLSMRRVAPSETQGKSDAELEALGFVKEPKSGAWFQPLEVTRRGVKPVEIKPEVPVVEEMPRTLPLEQVSKLETRIPLDIIRKDEVAEIERLTKEIQKEGIKEPITIRVREDGSRIVWDGLHRLIVAQNLGIKNIPVKFIGEEPKPPAVEGVKPPIKPEVAPPEVEALPAEVEEEAPQEIKNLRRQTWITAKKKGLTEEETRNIFEEVTGKRFAHEMGELELRDALLAVQKSITPAEQELVINNLAKEKMIMTEEGKPKPQLRNLMKGLVGKTRIEQLTQAEADTIIEALGLLEVKYGRPPKIPATVGLITKEFAGKIPYLKEIGIIEKVRPTRQVFEKMGLRKEVFEPAFAAEVAIYEELQAFRKEATEIEILVGKDPERRRLVFQELENPGTVVGLTFDEKRAVTWFRKYFDDWANKLNLPAEKRRANYVTHIFEEEIKQELATKHPLDPEMIKALDFITPKTIFNPFIQQRLGQTIGLREDPFAAASAYEARVLKVYHYEPLIQKIRVYEKYLPPHSAKYLRNFITRITGRPLTIDRELNQTLSEFGDAIKGLPGGEQLARAISRGNTGGLASYQFTSALYFLWLGFKPTSAIRNLSQHTLELAEVGPINFAEGIRLRFTEEGKSALKESLVLRSRRQAFIPGIDASFASQWTDKFRETALWMFRQADRQNVSDAFLGGYAEMKRAFPEAGREWWIKRGDEVAADTQYIYSQMGSAAWSQSAMGRTLSVLTTWPENWMELMTRFVKGRPSYVINEYAESVGKVVPKKNWLETRKAMILYMAIVALGFLIKEETRLRAWEYTGLTSLRYLADLAGGEFPALQYPGAVMNVIIGFLTDDERRLKEGWSQLKPVNLMGIIRTLDDVVAGEKDWLTLFFYLEGQGWKIKKLKEDWKKELGQYPLFETDEEYLEWIRTHPKQAGWSQTKIRNQWREDNPKTEAKLFITNQFSTLSTEAARQEALRLIEEHDLDTEEIKGYDKVFPLDTSDELDKFTGRIGNLEKLEVGKEAEYFKTSDFASEVNRLVNTVGRTKIEQDGNPFAVEYLRAKDQWEPYYDLPEDARILYRQQFPELEASLYLFGKVQSFKNPKSSDILLDLMEKYDIPPQGILAFIEKPERYDALFTREYTLKKKWFDLTTEYDNFSNTEAVNYIEDKEERKLEREKFREEHPDWMADMRRLEAIQHDASDVIVESWAERGVLIDEFSAGSSEAMVWLVDNPEVQKWALEQELLTDDGKDWNIPVLRINKKWRETDDKYLVYGDDKSEFYIEDDELREQARDKLLSNEEYRTDRRRREAFGDGFSEVENFVNYHELPVKGYRQEQFLLDNTKFAKEMHRIKGIDLPDPMKIPSPKYDDIYESREADFDKLWGLADSESPYYIENVKQREVARRSMLYTNGRPNDLFKDNKRLDAYRLFIPEKHIESYVKMAVELDKGYRDERYLKDNPDFYKDVWLGIMKNDRIDFSKVPAKQYDDLYDKHKDLFDKWDDYKDPDSPLYIDNAEDRKDARQILLDDNPAFAEARIRRNAYKSLIGHEEFVEDFVQYHLLPDKGYDNERFLQEHKEFYDLMFKLGYWTERIDFDRVPSPEVERLYEIYQNIIDPKEQLNYRVQHRDLDEWGQKVHGWKPAVERVNLEFASKEDIIYALTRLSVMSDEEKARIEGMSKEDILDALSQTFKGKIQAFLNRGSLMAVEKKAVERMVERKEGKAEMDKLLKELEEKLRRLKK